MTSNSERRTKLAVVGGFTQPRDDIAHGTHHAAYGACEAIARAGVYSEIHVFHERPVGDPARGARCCRARRLAGVFDKTEMPAIAERYQAIYVANGEQIGPVPHVLRPHEDWAPVICSVGTAHSAPQWQSLLLALASDSVRPTDGFVFKSRAAQTLFREVWTAWKVRLALEPAFPEGHGGHPQRRRRRGQPPLAKAAGRDPADAAPVAQRRRVPGVLAG